jgi:hypothetical protein
MKDFGLVLVLLLLSILIAKTSRAGTDFEKYRETNQSQWSKQIECESTMSEQLQDKKLCKAEKCFIEAKVICQIEFPLPPIPIECQGIIHP